MNYSAGTTNLTLPLAYADVSTNNTAGQPLLGANTANIQTPVLIIRDGIRWRTLTLSATVSPGASFADGNLWENGAGSYGVNFTDSGAAHAYTLIASGTAGILWSTVEVNVGASVVAQNPTAGTLTLVQTAQNCTLAGSQGNIDFHEFSINNNFLVLVANSTTNNLLVGSNAAYTNANVIGGTITSLINLPAIPANWITSAGIAAGAFASQSVQSVIGNVNGVVTPATAGTMTLVQTLTTYTGNTPQTGDSFGIVNGGSGNAAIYKLVASNHTQSGDAYVLELGLVNASDNTVFTAKALSLGPVGTSSGSGTVTVGGYAAGQDPLTLVVSGGNKINVNSAGALLLNATQGIVTFAQLDDTAGNLQGTLVTATQAFNAANTAKNILNASTMSTVTTITNTVSANLVSILGTAITGTAAFLAGAFSKFFNISSPTLTTASATQSGDAFVPAASANTTLAGLVIASAPTFYTVNALSNAPSGGGGSGTTPGQVWGMLQSAATVSNSMGSFLLGLSSGGLSGPNAITFQFNDASSVGVPSVDATISPGNTPIRTNSAGNYTAGMNSGTWTILGAITDNVAFPLTTFVVSGNGTVTITGTAVPIPSGATTSGFCQIYDTTYSFSGIKEGVQYLVTLTENSSNFSSENSSPILFTSVGTMPNNMMFTLPQGCTFTIQRGAGVAAVIGTVPYTNSASLMSIIGTTQAEIFVGQDGGP